MKAKSRTTLIFVSYFFGLLGVHRLLMGYKNWWLMPLTLGGLWIWSLTDFVRLLMGKMQMADGTPLRS